MSFLLLLLLTANAHATDPIVIMQSGPQRVGLLELFTSEGCSSCPPADLWFAKLKKSPGLWKNFVPVGFHVDYWDNLGWKDKFASKAATARQRAVAKTWSRPAVYTPGFVLDGKEWQNWRMSSNPPDEKGEAGTLKVTKLSKVTESYIVIYTPAKDDKTEKFVIHLALLGLGMKDKITGGENSGENLEHDFVVLDWKSEETARSKGEVSRELKVSSPHSQNMALAAWIEAASSPVPLQAVGGFLSTP